MTRCHHPHPRAASSDQTNHTYMSACCPTTRFSFVELAHPHQQRGRSAHGLIGGTQMSAGYQESAGEVRTAVTRGSTAPRTLGTVSMSGALFDTLQPNSIGSAPPSLISLPVTVSLFEISSHFHWHHLSHRHHQKLADR